MLCSGAQRTDLSPKSCLGLDMPRITSLQLVRFDPRSFHKKRKGALSFRCAPPTGNRAGARQSGIDRFCGTKEPSLAMQGYGREPTQPLDTRALRPGVSFFSVQRRRDTEARQGVRAAGLHGERSEQLSSPKSKNLTTETRRHGEKPRLETYCSETIQRWAMVLSRCSDSNFCIVQLRN